MSKSLGRLRAPVAASVAAILFASAASAAPATVDLVFYAPHFAKLENGSTIQYRFVRTAEQGGLDPSFEDKVTVAVGPQGAEDSVSIKLFTGARGSTLTNMSKTGNPVIVALLEQDVLEMQKALGGSPFYFRNRLRQALSEGPAAVPTKVEYAGRTVDGWRVTIRPFENDVKNRTRLKEFAARSYELTFADEVPGGLYTLRTVTPKASGEGALLTEELTLQASADAAMKPADGAK